MSTENNTVTVGDNRKLLSIGNAWINTRDAADDTKPRLTIKLDRDLGLNITLTANAQLLLFVNKKREGMQDADYRVAVSVPADIADREIARQKAAAEARRAETGAAAAATTVVEG